KNGFISQHVATALASMKAEAIDALPMLIEILGDPKANVEALVAIKKIGPAAAAAVPALLRTLKDDSETVRMNSANALGPIGISTEEGALALVEALNDQSPGVQMSAAESLRDGCTPEIIAILETTLKTDNLHDFAQDQVDRAKARADVLYNQ